MDAILNNINETLMKITERLDGIESRLMILEASARNMDEHISFVDTVYQRIQSPFIKLMGWIDGSGTIVSPGRRRAEQQALSLNEK
jgi:hypothetical protein